MTDTTDIAALREAVESAADCGYTHRVYVDGRLLESLLDALEAAEKKNALVAGGIDAALKMQEQLEAERQRADYGQRVIAQRNAECDRLIKELEVAEARVKELEALKGDQVPVGWEVCSPEWCNKHKACHEAPRIWFESEDGTGPHYHPSEYPAPQNPVVMASHEDCQSCDRHYVDGMKAGWNFHEEGDNQGFINSIERVQKDMREARNGRVKNDA